MKKNKRKKKASGVHENNNQGPFFPSIQTKLAIGKADDIYEKEADSVADKVVNSSAEGDSIQKKGGEEEQLQEKPISQSITSLQKQDMSKEEEPVQKVEEKEEAVQKMEEEEPIQEKTAANEEEPVQKAEETEEDPVQKAEEEEKIQKKRNGNTSNAHVETAIKNSKGQGQKMDKSTRSEMEKGFGADFSNVNIHTDSKAQETSQELGAQAFTTGNDIYFNEGKYDPNSKEGKHLLAHELTHTIQQRKDTLQLYRNNTATNFGSQDSGSLKEDSFNIKTDKEKKPWIKKITINLDKAPKKDKNGLNYYTGTLVAKYYANSHALSDISFSVSAGSDAHKTSEANHLVHRIESVGYMSSDYSAPYTPDPDNPRYNIDKTIANMHNAIFFKGAQAIHQGALDEASHGCVHVESSLLTQLNYHTVKGLTAVILKYV